MEDETFKKRKSIMIDPVKIYKRQDTLFNCSDCYKSIKKNDCTVLFFCNKCNVKICVNCFDGSGKCVNCFGNLDRFEKRDTIYTPDTLDDFIEINIYKRKWMSFNKWWCCNR